MPGITEYEDAVWRQIALGDLLLRHARGDDDAGAVLQRMLRPKHSSPSCQPELSEPQPYHSAPAVSVVFEYQLSAALGRPIDLGTPPKRIQRGRPRSTDRVRLEAAASMWLDLSGTPEKQADLEAALADWCQVEGIELSERTIRTVAAVALRKHEERRVRLH